MEIEGKIILDLGLTSGTSKAGNPWKKREWVLETFGTYPKKVKFHVFGDRVDMMNIEVGRDYTLSFDIESREFNGRWYTDISVYKCAPYGQQAMEGQGQPYPGAGMGGYPGSMPPQQPPMGGMPFGQPAQPAAPYDFQPDDNGDDLPF